MSSIKHQCKGIKKNGKRCEMMLNSKEYCKYHEPNNTPKDEGPMDTRFKEDCCCICTDEFKSDFRPLKECGHWVHQECVARSGKSECPVCRIKVSLGPKHKIRKVDLVSDYANRLSRDAMALNRPTIQRNSSEFEYNGFRLSFSYILGYLAWEYQINHNGLYTR